MACPDEGDFSKSIGEEGDIPETLGEEKIEAICQKYERKLILSDAERILKGRFNPIYEILMEQEGTQSYLKANINFCSIKIISQLRLNGKRYVKLTSNRCVYSWDQERECEACNLRENESTTHFLINCPTYIAIREVHLSTYLSPRHDSTTNLTNLLTKLHPRKIIAIANFTATALKIRSFLLNE